MAKISNQFLSRLSSLLLDHTGLYYPENRWEDLEKGVLRLTAAGKFKNLAACLAWLMEKPSARGNCRPLETLASHLSVQETYFYRESDFFQAFENEILPYYLSKKFSGPGKTPSLRLWSAGCCTGEEPYSLAIALTRKIPDISRWKVQILATDINQEFLEKAEQGKYKHWSFRTSLPWEISEYFQKDLEGFWEISPKIKSMVEFSQLNLMDFAPGTIHDKRHILGDFDMIFCRNVFIYFGQAQIRSTIKKFYECLGPSGIFMVAPAETIGQDFGPFTARTFGNTFVYLKETEKYAAPQPQPQPSFQGQGQPKPEISAEPPSQVRQPEGSPDNFEKAWKHFQQKDYDLSKKILLSMAGNPLDIRPRILLARICANQRDFPGAKSWIGKALEIDKLNPVVHFLHGLTEAECGHKDGAINALEKSIYMDHEFLFPHFMLATLQLSQGKTLDAERNLKHALDLLNDYEDYEIIPESDGLNSGQLKEIIKNMMKTHSTEDLR